MGVIDSLKKWFSAVTDPLCGANKVADDLNSAHQDFMRGFASIIGTMVVQQVSVKAATDVTADMSGDGADAIVQEAMSYLQVSVSVTPTPGLVLAGAPVQAAAGIGQGATEVSQLSEFGTLSAKAAADVEEALQNAGVQIGEDAGLDTVTEVVDGAAVAEAGANPIADAVALILTLVTAFFFLKTLYDMAWAVYDVIQDWQKAATNACQPLPALPTLPQTPLPLPPIPKDGTPPKLTLEEQNEAQRIYKKYGGQISMEDIIAIILSNPNASPDELDKLIADCLGLQSKVTVFSEDKLVYRYGSEALPLGFTPELVAAMYAQEKVTPHIYAQATIEDTPHDSQESGDNQGYKGWNIK